MVIASNLDYICCVYKEEIVKNDSYRRAYKFQKVAIFNSDICFNMNKRRLVGDQMSLALCFCMMVYLSTYANPLYSTSDLRQIRYNTTHPTY